MIGFALDKHTDGIKRLWKNAFGDEDINEFLKNYKKNILVYIENGNVCGMLSMLPILMGEEKGRYIYAVATDENYRGRGISSELLEWARKYSQDMGEKFLVLVPAEKSLFNFYEKRGYSTVLCVERKEVLKTEFDGITVEKILSEELYKLRKEYFQGRNFAEWGIADLEYISKMYDGNFYKIISGNDCGFAVCSYSNGILDIKELCISGINVEKAASALMDVFGTVKCRAAVPSVNGEPFAMVLPEQDMYFNIAMD